jgi:hypothetical protein
VFSVDYVHVYLKQSVLKVRPKSTAHKNNYCRRRASPIFAYSSLGPMMEKVSYDLIHRPINS